MVMHFARWRMYPCKSFNKSKKQASTRPLLETAVGPPVFDIYTTGVQMQQNEPIMDIMCANGQPCATQLGRIMTEFE